MEYLLLFFILGVAAQFQDETETTGYVSTNIFLLPEQIHIAYGDEINDITVTWSTMNDTKETILYYGEGKLDKKVIGVNKLFVDGGLLKWKQWIHNVELKNLKYDTKYGNNFDISSAKGRLLLYIGGAVYRVGSKYGWSKQFSFKTPPAGEEWPVHALIYGDLGVQNKLSLPYIEEDVAKGHYDFIIHVGDFAYDMHDNNGVLGSQFLNNIQPIASKLPYMVCPGNHENAYNFSHYRKRFSMPGNSENFFYSYNIGPVHFVSINTEAYYNDDNYPFYHPLRGGWTLPVSKEVLQTQFNWLKQDLKGANKKENRQKRPWIILYGHRPLYCSNNDPDDRCRYNEEYPHRVGIPSMGGYGLEPLLKEYKVDVAIWAHEHSYERMWPMYDKVVYNGSYDHPYVNAGALVQITTGSAGCKEETRTFFSDPLKWSAFRSRDYGYTRFIAHNKTHLQFEQISTHEPTTMMRVEGAPKKIDEFWLVKDRH